MGIGRHMCEAIIGEMRIAYEMVTGKSVRTRIMRSLRCRWRDNIEMEVKEMLRMCSGFNWLRL
jgi:hypothetical protein